MNKCRSLQLATCCLALSLSSGCQDARNADATITMDSIQTKEQSDVQVIHLTNEHISASFIPALGGKIVSLKSANGREYLSRSHKEYTNRSYGMKYGDTEFDGIDECFPSLANSDYPSAPWKDTAIPDHGEVCQLAWSYEQTENSVSMSVSGKAFPYTFSRTASLDKNTLHLDYTISNNSDHDFQSYYAFHPLFAGESGCGFEFNDETPIQLALSAKNYLGTAGKQATWSTFTDAEGALLKDQQFTKDSNKYYKYYTDKLSTGSLKLRYKNGDSLNMQWPTEIMPFIAVWCSQGACGGLNHIAAEPCTSREDALADAHKKQETLLIPAQKSISWRISLSID